ncbi:SET domain protein [Medicago truncatula]|uniref:SET domain protein n=1 Tax=Medicago truncatula TaxID=3880 RepID=G7ZX51_MEDTR|nr:SET domain protein [Medicago truncatula]
MYIEVTGKKHIYIRLAIGNDIYCCVHFLRKKENMLKFLLQICRGTIVVGSRCKHHNSITRFTFCKKHLCNANTNKCSNSNFRTLKWKAEET